MGTGLLFVLCLCGASVVSGAHSSSTCATSLQQSTQCLDTCYNTSVACSEMHGDSCPLGLFCKEDCCQCGRYPSDIIITPRRACAQRGKVIGCVCRYIIISESALALSM